MGYQESVMAGKRNGKQSKARWEMWSDTRDNGALGLSFG